MPSYMSSANVPSASLRGKHVEEQTDWKKNAMLLWG